MAKMSIFCLELKCPMYKRVSGSLAGQGQSKTPQFTCTVDIIRHTVVFSQFFDVFKGKLHLKPKLSMFCALSQIINSVFDKYSKHPEANCLRNLKLSYNIPVGQADFQELITMCKILFSLITEELLRLSKILRPLQSYSDNLLQHIFPK